MKNGKMMGKLAAMALVIALSAGKSMATGYVLAAGTFTVLTHEDGLCENPNGFPVVTVASSQLANGQAGFLLNGSESASHWLKVLQDARLNNRQIRLYTDDNWNHALCGRLGENGYSGGAYKIVALEELP